MKRITIILFFSLFSLALIFASCNSKENSASEDTQTKDTPILVYIKQCCKKQIDTLSNGYFVFEDCVIKDGKGYIFNDGIEKWEISYVAKVKCVKSGGDIYSDANNNLREFEVKKIADYSNAITKEGEYYKIFNTISIKRNGYNWVISH